MAALFNEIAYYAKSQFKQDSRILIFGLKCEKLAACLRKFNVTSCQDVEKLSSQKASSFDAIISLFKFMEFNGYKETEKFLSTLITLLKDDGLIQICEHTGDSFLNLAQYTNKFESHVCQEGDECYSLSLIWEQCLRDSIHSKNDWNDHCWMLKKYRRTQKVGTTSIRAFLDQDQYTEFNIRSYEWIFGAGFISPGGAAQNAKFLAQLELQPGETLMDIGCGIGGNAFQTAREYGANVIGVDLSSNMVTVACDRACLRRDTRVRFMIADITKYDFPPNTFEVIYSRDAIIHIPDKKALFTKCYKWLKPGGRMLITDYHVGDGKLTDGFVEFVKNRQYTLLPLRMYEEAAQGAGFEKVETEDLTNELKGTILDELQRANDNKEEFMQMFSAEKFDFLISGWKNKIGFIDSGCHKWGILKAVKKAQ